MDKRKIWVLEDDKGCQFVYEQTLVECYELTLFSTLSSFFEALNTLQSAGIKENYPDLILADLMLEDGNFLNHLMNAEKPILDIPFIIVSSIDDIDALRLCFREGALDYLTKPFKKNELIVKIENVLTGTRRIKNEVIETVQEEGPRTIVLDGKEIKGLTSKQGQLIQLFLSSTERAISRQDILDKVWGGTAVHPKTVDVHLYNLRRKLHSFGYMIRSEGGGKWSLIPDTYEAYHQMQNKN